MMSPVRISACLMLICDRSSCSIQTTFSYKLQLALSKEGYPMHRPTPINANVMCVVAANSASLKNCAPSIKDRHRQNGQGSFLWIQQNSRLCPYGAEAMGDPKANAIFGIANTTSAVAKPFPAAPTFQTQAQAQWLICACHGFNLWELFAATEHRTPGLF